MGGMRRRVGVGVGVVKVKRMGGRQVGKGSREGRDWVGKVRKRRRWGDGGAKGERVGGLREGREAERGRAGWSGESGREGGWGVGRGGRHRKGGGKMVGANGEEWEMWGGRKGEGEGRRWSEG